MPKKEYPQDFDEWDRTQADRYGVFKTVTGTIRPASPGEIAQDWKLRGY